MSTPTRSQTDLGYVRAVVERAESVPAPRAVYFLWAAIVLVGFPLPDWAPEAVGRYWLVAGPLGWILSAVLGQRHARSVGQLESAVGRRHGLHWLLMFIVIVLATLMPARGIMAWQGLSALVLLIVALAYLMASLYLDRLLLFPGILMLVGYAVLLFQPAWAWTIVGVLVSLGLVVSGLVGGRTHVPQEA